MKSIKSDKNNRGFTLIELLVTLGLVGIVMALAYQLFFFGLNSWHNSNDTAEAIATGQLLQTYVSQEVREATKAVEEESAIEVQGDCLIIYTYAYSQQEEAPQKVVYDYMAEEQKLHRKVYLAENHQYPYQYTASFSTSTVFHNIITEEAPFTVIEEGRRLVLILRFEGFSNRGNTSKIELRYTVRGRETYSD
ncbi:MAG: prepilin-type N-terminal cleavage/methylation domain-containing protein [Clostridiaceae bacterium]|nr:prepilin-type N-terminal cleavage/methylation domain-containing protein [Clostridiaceae bacterium]